MISDVVLLRVFIVQISHVNSHRFPFPTVPQFPRLLLFCVYINKSRRTSSYPCIAAEDLQNTILKWSVLLQAAARTLRYNMCCKCKAYTPGDCTPAPSPDSTLQLSKFPPGLGYLYLESAPVASLCEVISLFFSSRHYDVFGIVSTMASAESHCNYSACNLLLAKRNTQSGHRVLPVHHYYGHTEGL